MDIPVRIDTERLIMRMPAAEDAAVIATKYAQDPEVTRYLVWKPHQNLEETRRFILQCIGKWKQKTAFPWVALRKTDQELVGMIELRIQGNEADLGYVLAKDGWGRGYATEMVTAVVNFLQESDSIKRIWAVCDCENRASARVLEKAGFTQKGVLPKYMIHPNVDDNPRDCLLYEILCKCQGYRINS